MNPQGMPVPSPQHITPPSSRTTQAFNTNTLIPTAFRFSRSTTTGVDEKGYITSSPQHATSPLSRMAQLEVYTVSIATA